MGVPSACQNAMDRQVGRSAFGLDAQSYDDARSGYPPELFELLAIRTAPSPQIAEIGPGTGLASLGLFGLSPTCLTLIEPDRRLCRFLEQRFPRADARIVCAPFPDLEIEGQFDLITCAAAFHWMEPVAALAKVRSLLAPHGIWGMWWNSYFGHGVADPFADCVSRILTEERVTLPPSYIGSKHYAFDVAHHRCTLSNAGFDETEHFLFRTPRDFNASQARDLLQSFSFIRVLPVGTQAKIGQRITTVIEEEFGGKATSFYATSLFMSRVDIESRSIAAVQPIDARS